MLRGTILLLALAFSFLPLPGQSTQSQISGRLLDSRNGRSIPGGLVRFTNPRTNVTGESRTDSAGYFTLPLLSPGDYRLRAEAADYQAQEIYEMNLAVAARVNIEFRLRPLNDVWEQGQYRSVFLPGTRTVVTFYGPDVDSSRTSSFENRDIETGTLDPAVSDVVDTKQISDLPLAGRDVYATLVTQPAVSTDAAAGRGLGLSVNGQRPSSSNFLLDGLENNNYLVTGPLTSIAPESIQEYRVSTSSYSAASGRTAGYIANTVSRTGGNELHGTTYFYQKNEALNANEFQRNRFGQARKKLREFQTGGQVGGPIIRNKLFFSGAFEYFDSGSERDPVSVNLPTPDFVDQYTSPDSSARKLLTEYPAPVVEAGDFPWAGELTVNPPVDVRRYLGIARVDYRKGTDSLMGRFTFSNGSRPNFIWSPYEAFTSGLNQDTFALAASWIKTPKANLTNEFRFGYSIDKLNWDRAHPEVPTLITGDGVTLPGSSAFYEYKNDNGTLEVVDNLVWNRERHTVTVGGGLLLRSSDGFQTVARDGQYGFDNLIFFGLDRPSFFSAAVNREDLPDRTLPRYDRDYNYNQLYFFAQDSFRITRRLTLNYGARYEYFGAPKNTGNTKDASVEFGDGADINERLANAGLVFPGSGNQSLHRQDKNDWAVRIGVAYQLTPGTVLRASYGVFYDRPFDNLWQNTRNNNLTLPLFTVKTRFDYLQPVEDALQEFSGQPILGDFPKLTMHDPGLKTGYAQHYMVGLQQSIGKDLSIEINGLGAGSRRLITTDIINRQFTTTTGDGRTNEELPDIAYRAGQGSSNYHALGTAIRYRASRAQFQFSYTWSHVIDNQSEPLAGDFFDLSFTRVGGSSGGGRSAFSRQFDSSADRGDAAFDQRHNVVFSAITDLPYPETPGIGQTILRDWRIAGLAAWRSGFPYSVLAVSEAQFGQGLIINNRANLLDPSQIEPDRPAEIPGGKQLLIADGFGRPGPSALGNLGRNTFQGPSFSTINFSLSRSLTMPSLGEQGRLVFRADAFNLFNHTNLNPPDSLLQSETFGQALYGRRGRDTGFPAVSPLNESAREFQLMIRLQF